jgi:ubiquinone biosynthesis O-methyltransferase
MQDIFHSINKIVYGHSSGIFLLEKDKIQNIDFSITEFIKKERVNIEILDLGCGHGELSIPLLKLGYKLDCVDLDKSNLSELREKLKKIPYITKRVKVVNSSIEKYNLDKKYDVVLLTEVLEHVDHPEEILKKIYQLLKNNGICILSIPNGFGTYEIFFDWPIILFRKMLGIKTPSGRYHINFFSFNRIKRIFKDNNFEVIKLVKHVFFPILPFKNRLIQLLDIKLARICSPWLINGWIFVLKKQ